MTPRSVLDFANNYRRAGMSIIPIRADGSKAPVVPWKHRQRSKPTISDLRSEFISDTPIGIGIVAGKVSGNLEVLDFDDYEAFQAWKKLIPSKLLKRLPMIETPRGGRHVYYRCKTIEGSQKLAEATSSTRKTLIETRGEGGYCLAPGSSARCHETQKEYRHLAGPSLCKVPTITPDERETLHAAARSLNQCPPKVVEAPSSNGLQNRPGDQYNRSATWDDILTPHGWTCIKTEGTTRYWRRPGKRDGCSATTGYCSNGDTDLLYVFSSNAHPFEPSKAYSKFAAFAMLNHNGDFQAAAKAIQETCGVDQTAEPLRFVPFPVDAMPNPIRGIVRRAANALGCDESFVVLPLVTALAAAIGNTRRLRLKPGWDVPPIIWAVIVAPSGTVKSPAIDIARKPVDKRQRQAMKQYKEVAKAYEAERKDAKDSNQSDNPIAGRYWCDDVTMEALVVRLQEQPRGMLVIRDELSGWFGGFDRYVGGKGGDAPKWLEAYGGRPMLVDRKSGEAIHVPRAAVCVTGSIQPAILKRSLSTAHRENGMAARMLFAYPPRREKRWTDRGIEPRDHETIASIFDHLYDLKFATDAEGEPEPIVIQPTDEAKALFVTYFDAHNGEAAELSDDLGAAWSKLEEYAARLALVVHYVRWAIKDKALNDELRLDAVSMKAGIQLAQWFAHEARRVYAMLDEGNNTAKQRKLVEWIERKGGRVTPSSLLIFCPSRYAHDGPEIVMRRGV